MALSVGVDVSENRGLDVVVLSSNLDLARPPARRVTPDGLGALLSDLGPEVSVVAIDSPPGIGLSGRTRPCETELRRRGVNVFSTPSDAAWYARPFYNWMRVGEAAFDAAAAAGFALYDGGPSVRGFALEVFPHASDVCLRGARPPAGVTRRASTKRAWRTATLVEAGFSAVDRLTSLDAVDAALAALTGVLALTGRFEALGRSPYFVVVPTS